MSLSRSSRAETRARPPEERETEDGDGGGGGGEEEEEEGSSPTTARLHETPRTAAAQNLRNETKPAKVSELLYFAKSSAVNMHLRAGMMTISLAERGGARERARGQRGGPSSAAEGAVGGMCGAGPEESEE